MTSSCTHLLAAAIFAGFLKYLQTLCRTQQRGVGLVAHQNLRTALVGWGLREGVKHQELKPHSSPPKRQVWEPTSRCDQNVRYRQADAWNFVRQWWSHAAMSNSSLSVIRWNIRLYRTATWNTARDLQSIAHHVNLQHMYHTVWQWNLFGGFVVSVLELYFGPKPRGFSVDF